MRHSRLRRGRATAVVVVLSVVAAGAGAGCGSTTAASPAQDSAFLAEVHDDAPDIATYRSDTALVRLGHAVCDGFAAGASYEVLADRLVLQEGSTAIPSADLGTVISAATQVYCPRYGDLTH